jgi:hypothetical protein
MEAVRWLRESGLAVSQEDAASAPELGADAVLVVTAGESRARFAVELKRRTPYPNELAGLSPVHEMLSRLGEPLLVVLSCPSRWGLR